jgi:hypothetical protein
MDPKNPQNLVDYFVNTRRTWRASPVRKDVSMTTAEKVEFLRGLTLLKTAPADGSLSVYDWFVQLHMDAMPPQVGTSTAHEGPAFLPWHRRFLFEFELQMAAALGIPTSHCRTGTGPST